MVNGMGKSYIKFQNWKFKLNWTLEEERNK